MEDIRDILEKNYNVKIKNIEKIKRAYKVTLFDESVYSFKILEYNFGHFLFIIAAMRYLYDDDFYASVKIMRSTKGEDYVRVFDRYGYLSEWKDGRSLNYDNIFDLELATRTLSDMHRVSMGFETTKDMNPRYYWHSWIKTFETRKEEILDFKRRIEEKEVKTDFDKMYLNEVDAEVKRCEDTNLRLIKNNYLEVMDKHIKNKSFCHHDYAHHNILLDSDKNIFLIDFDYCILDTHLHDLSSLLIRKMKNGNWDLKVANFILSIYNKKIEVTEEDIKLMASFIGFPQEFWQIGIQYYWEDRKKGDDIFINRLSKILSDRIEREEFVGEFMNFKL